MKIKWLKRLPFDYNKTIEIPLKDITKLRIDRQLKSNQRAVKIYFNSENSNIQGSSLFINSYENKVFKCDIVKLIEYLTELSTTKSIPVTNHWEEWNEKGYIKFTKRLIAVSVVIILTYFILKQTAIVQ